MNSDIQSDDIKKRIASLKEELDRKKAKLKRSLQTKASARQSVGPGSETADENSPRLPKRVRFSDTNVSYPPADEDVGTSDFSSYVLSQSLFDDSVGDASWVAEKVEGEESMLDDCEKANRRVALLPVPCCQRPSRCSVLDCVSHTYVSLTCESGAQLFHVSSDDSCPPTCVWSRQTAASTVLLAELVRSPVDGCPAILVSEKKDRHFVSNCLSLEGGRIASVFPVHAEPCDEPLPRVTVEWTDDWRRGVLLVNSPTQQTCRLVALTWGDGELGKASSCKLQFEVDFAVAVSEEYTLAVCGRDGRTEVGVVSFADGGVRRLRQVSGACRPVHLRVVGVQEDLLFIAGVCESREEQAATMIFLDCLCRKTWRLVQLRQMAVDLQRQTGPRCFCFCDSETLLVLGRSGFGKLSINWRRETTDKSNFDLATCSEWTFSGCFVRSSFFAWLSGDTVSVLLIGARE